MCQVLRRLGFFYVGKEISYEYSVTAVPVEKCRSFTKFCTGKNPSSKASLERHCFALYLELQKASFHWRNGMWRPAAKRPKRPPVQLCNQFGLLVG